jgi:hypothetical protein
MVDEVPLGEWRDNDGRYPCARPPPIDCSGATDKQTTSHAPIGQPRLTVHWHHDLAGGGAVRRSPCPDPSSLSRRRIAAFQVGNRIVRAIPAVLSPDRCAVSPHRHHDPRHRIRPRTCGSGMGHSAASHSSPSDNHRNISRNAAPTQLSPSPPASSPDLPDHHW